MNYFRTLLMLLFTGIDLMVPEKVLSQGKNHNWLLGYSSGIDTNVITKRAIVNLNSNQIQIISKK